MVSAFVNRPTPLLFSLLGLLMLLCSQQASANHLGGAVIEYECISPGEWYVELRILQDCLDTTITPEAIVRIVNQSNSFASATLPLISQEDISQVCPQEAAQGLCNGGLLPGYTRLTYAGIVSDLWDSETIRILWKRNYRTESVNIDTSNNLQFYVHCIINRSASPCDDSPKAEELDIAIASLGQATSLNFGVLSSDTDSLHFSYTDVLNSAPSNGSTSVPYASGYDGETFLDGATIDPSTGQMTFTPMLQGKFTLAVKLEQYDIAGNLKGTQILDAQIVVLSPAQGPQSLSNSILENYSGTADLTGPYTIRMDPGESFCASMTFASTSSSGLLALETSLAQVLPGATVEYTGLGPITATICYTAELGHIGGIVTFLARDFSCPFTGEHWASFNVVIADGTPFSSTTISACTSYTDAQGTLYTQSTTLIDSLVTVSGEDSLSITVIDIFQVNAQVFNNVDNLSAPLSDSYQWVVCDGDFSPVVGATEQVFVPDSSNSYAVILEQEGCTDTSDCLFINLVGIGLNEFVLDARSMYPNPMRDRAQVDLDKINGALSLMMYDISGRLVREQWIDAQGGELEGTMLNIARGDLQAGRYVLIILAEDEGYQVPFVVE